MVMGTLGAFGFWSGSVLLTVAAIFLVLYYRERTKGPLTGSPYRPTKWLWWSGGTYLSSLGLGLLLVVIAMFRNVFPDMGDFPSVSWTNGNMTASNSAGVFQVRGMDECRIVQPDGARHRIAFTLKNGFEGPVTVHAFNVHSRMEEGDLEGYVHSPPLPFVLDLKESRAVEMSAGMDGRISTHADKGNKDRYGLTAYLSVVTSAGRLPGVPLRFPEKTCDGD